MRSPHRKRNQAPRAICLLFTLILCFSMILPYSANAYAGNERMSSGDAEVVDAILMNLADYAIRVYEEEADIVLDISDPASMFLDEKVTSALEAVPGCGPMLKRIYSYGKMTAEALWELGGAIGDAVLAAHELTEASFSLAAEEQKLLTSEMKLLYLLGKTDYEKNTMQTKAEIEAAFSNVREPTSVTIADLRDSAKHVIFDITFNRKGRQAIESVADALEEFADSMPSLYESYQIGHAVAKAMDDSQESVNTNSYVVQRLNALSEALEGVYFTTTGSSCGNSNCDSCAMVNVIATSRFKALVNNFVPASSVTSAGIHHDYGKNNPFTNGWSCCGFSNFAGWYLFAEKTTDKVVFNCICPNGTPIKFTNSALRDAGIKPGDVLRFSQDPTKGKDGHSAIFVGFTDSGILALDSNYRLPNDEYNRIRTHEIPYTMYSYVCISRADNYDEIDQKEPSNTDEPGTKTQYRYHMYVNENGKRFVCPYAGQQSYPGTTFKIVYTEWLDAPLTVNNGSYSYYVHTKTSSCEAHGCIDASWQGNRYVDSQGKTWVCQETRTVSTTCAHSYSNSCDATCNDCGAARTVAHSYATKWSSNSTNHWHACTLCDHKKDTAKHTYDNACDTSCNVCGATRTITHSYEAKLSTDGTSHWHACSVCGDKKDVAKHTPGAAATETTPQTCSVCGYVLQAALGHTHKYGNDWVTDGVQHWKACACGAKESIGSHSYDHACDTSCNTCGYTRVTSHSLDGTWLNDENGHWNKCTVCQATVNKNAHTPGAAATETTDQTCTVCNYAIAPALGHSHKWESTYASNETEHWYTCAGCEEKKAVAAHVFENNCDADCGVCGYKRTVAHTPGPAATETTAQTCTTCGEVLSPAIGSSSTESTQPVETPTEPAETPTESVSGQPTQPGTEPTAPTLSTPQSDPNEDENALLTAIALAAVIGMTIFAVAFIVVLKKKH